MNYKKEASFALQYLTDNDFLATTAMGNQDSLKRSIINVAAIGLSLDPVKKLAYLVPRDKKVCLDISYRGYVQLAVDIGAVKWVSAEIVRKLDTFEYQGMNREPVHRFQPFGDRGDIVGAYCVAKTHDGEFILTMMTVEELLAIRDRSTSYKSGKNSPWTTDESEMIKKTVIKRAAKSWPMTDTRVKERFEQAIDVTNDINFNEPTPTISSEVSERELKFQKMRDALVELGRTEEKLIEHLVRVNRREIKKLQDLTDIEISQAIVMLNQFVDQKLGKEQKNEVAESNSKKS